MAHTKPTEAAKLPTAESVELSTSTKDAPLSGVPKASKSSRTPSRSLIAELAPHVGYASITLDHYGRDDYSRRSTRICKATAKASVLDTYMDPPAKLSPTAKPAGPAKVSKSAIKKPTAKRKPKSSPTAAQKARKAAEILLELAEDTDATSAAETLSPATLNRSPTTSPTPSDDLLAAVALFNLGHVCVKHESTCTSCTALTVAPNGLVKSACGNFSWYVGPMGIFEIGELRWPRLERTVTYVLGDGYMATTAPSSRPTTPDSDADTELDEQMAEEEVEEQEEREVEADRFLEGQIAEWTAFCKFGEKMAWGAWLNRLQRPDHIESEKWDKWHEKYWDDVDEKWEAKKAANPMKYWF